MNYCVPPNASPAEISHYAHVLGLGSPLEGPAEAASTSSQQSVLPQKHNGDERLKEGRNGSSTSTDRGQQPVTMRSVSEHEDEHGLPLQRRGAAEEGALARPDSAADLEARHSEAVRVHDTIAPASDQLKGPVRSEALHSSLARYSSDSVLSTASFGPMDPSITHWQPPGTVSSADPSLPDPTDADGDSPGSKAQSRSSSTGSSASHSGGDGGRARDGKWRQHQQLVPRMSLETVEKARDVEDRPPQRPTHRRSRAAKGPQRDQPLWVRPRAEGEPPGPTKAPEDGLRAEESGEMAARKVDITMPRWGRAQSEELRKQLRRGDVSPSIEETNV